MKKFIYIIIVLFLSAAAYEFYSNHKVQILNFTQGIKSGTAIENLKTEIFTPGGLRARFEAENASLTDQGTIEITNQYRIDHGLKVLRENKKLNEAALKKVKDMFAGQYFEHISPTGKGPADLAKEANYVYISVGENLALGNYKDDAALVEAWMNSPGHRANILHGKFTEIGVAVLKGKFEGKTTWLAVQEFGRPASECPRVDEFLRQQIETGKQEIDSMEQQVISAKSQLEGWPEPQSKEEVDAYNAKVGDYNSLIKIYNNRIDTQKSRVDDYNFQVRAFNECIGSN